ncbi:HelD family protein [Amycolatopsis sp.]|uniref:HelD family protein n=1 Tax=Amycolatopsis sp. TaxID=37632 RepID=UPI002D7FF4DC|nr:ATP-binding domain-containing protein [Amycolatopsis sp.]HET6705472.1 ATP-binding domain-containing protein [Amycolatopsis sp.]
MPSRNSRTETDRELAAEQEYLTALHAEADALRHQAAARLAAADRTTTPFWRAELDRLESAEDGLCFGRLDLRDGGRRYVGRLGLFRADEALLLDWRAPAARPFYTATLATPYGVRRRRRITTRGREVIALDDELLDTEAADDVLVGGAALLAALTARRTGRMHDIVTTLQAEQDRIVRDDHPGVLVVQGGPGTGKTAVALHRLAYLLYARPHLRTRGALVVGPSRVFLGYIGQVLPGLGEHAVVTSTVAELGPDVRIGRTDPPGTAVAKGRAEMAGRIAAAVRSRVRPPAEPLDLHFEQQVLRLAPRTCREAIDAAASTGLPHNPARLVFQQRLVDALARDLADRMENVVFDDTGAALDGGSADGRLSEADLRALAAAGVVTGPGPEGPRRILDETDVARLRTALLADAGVGAVLDELWPPLTAAEVVAQVLGTSGEAWSAADVPLLDEAAAVLGERACPTFGHVVVDEAQELSAMAWRMLLRRCPTRSMTVVGDLAQTGDPAGATARVIPWDGLRPPVSSLPGATDSSGRDAVPRSHVDDRWRLAELTVNYRTPAEVMAVAAPLLAAHHPGLRPPRSVRHAGEHPWRRRTALAELPDVLAGIVARHDDGRLAVIAPPVHHARIAAAVPVTTPPDPTDPVVVLTPRQAKGLEFDAVLVVDPAAILAEPLGHNDLYVALTRTTRHLGILHPGPPPAELAGVRERTA